MSIIRLISVIAGLAVLLVMTPGCAGRFAMPSGDGEPLRLKVTELQGLNNWLDISARIGELPVEQASARLQQMDPPETANEHFYYGLLNQQLNRFEGWIQARDSFRVLASDATLDASSRELARILLVHNQALINWHERHRHLQKELAVSVLDRELMEEKHKVLEQKIEALTELEAAISHRKQQGIETDSLKVKD